MSYDITLHIPESSDEGRAIAAIANENKVSLTTAATLLLKQGAKRQVAKVKAVKSKESVPGRLLFGLFSDVPEVIDQIVQDAANARKSEIVTDYRA